VEEDFYSVDEAARIMKLTPGRIRQMLRASEVDFIAPRLQAFALPIIQGIRFFSAEPRPKAGRGAGRGYRGCLGFRKYYTKVGVRHHTGALGVGVGLSVLHRIRAKHTLYLFYAPLGFPLACTGRGAAGFFFAFWRFGMILNGFFF
jgi:hypothetical protein